MNEEFNKIMCHKCGIELFYKTINTNIECTRCGTNIILEESDEEQVCNIDMGKDKVDKF